MTPQYYNLETARQILKAFRFLLSHTRITARNGSKKAAKNVMIEMAANHRALKAFGYTTNDEGKLVEIKPFGRSKSVKNTIADVYSESIEAHFQLMKRWSDAYEH